MPVLPASAALLVLLGLAACSGSVTGVGASGEPVRFGFDNQLVTGQSPGGTWNTAGNGQEFDSPNSLPAGAEGIGQRVRPLFP